MSKSVPEEARSLNELLQRSEVFVFWENSRGSFIRPWIESSDRAIHVLPKRATLWLFDGRSVESGSAFLMRLNILSHAIREVFGGFRFIVEASGDFFLTQTPFLERWCQLLPIQIPSRASFCECFLNERQTNVL